MHFYEKTINNITINDIILKTNLYKKIEIDWHDYQTVTQYGYDLGNKYPIGHDVYYSKEIKALLEFLSNEFKIYGKCPHCDKSLAMSVLSYKPVDSELLTKPIWSYREDVWNDTDTGSTDLTESNMKEIITNLCKSHKYIDKYFSCPICQEIYRASYALSFENEKLFLIKIGQYSSLRDFNQNYTNRFLKDLKKKELKKEYEQALITHDEGHSVAAYAYMRRVIEKLILQKFNEKERDKTLDEFKHLHFDEKLDYLKSDLPELLQSKKLYELSSAGIHKLTEDECEFYFPILKQAIELILIDEAKKAREKQFRKQLNNDLENATYKIKKNLEAN